MTVDVKVLPPPTSVVSSPFDFRDSERLMRAGQSLGERWLAREAASPAGLALAA